MRPVVSARRLLILSTLALSVGLPLLACSGGGRSHRRSHRTPRPPSPKIPPRGSSARGACCPRSRGRRQLRIISAALSGQKKKKQRLGKLTPEEEELFKEWEGKKGPEVREIRKEIRYNKNYLIDITDSTVTVQFGTEETHGPVDYEVVSATETNTTIRFDPGLGNGMETHSFEWTSPTKGVDHITDESGKKFNPLNITRKK